MIRITQQTLGRSSARTLFAPARTVAGRRCISTEPAHLRSRGWRSSALRWGLAAAGIYYYNTSPVFAEQPQHNLLNPNVDAIDTENSPTLEALTASSRRKAEKDASVLQSVVEQASQRAVTSEAHGMPDDATDVPATSSSPAELEEEAEGQGAFNPITGEINWDCPCLGGMAHGPCGPEFREAFSCFVYSTEEPKGMECIDKFQNMQNCFREHPEHYKAELEDDEELDAELAQEREEMSKKFAERQEADRQAAQESSAAPIEEPATVTRKSKSVKKSKGTKGENPSSQRSAPVAASSEPHPGMSADHEAVNEGQNSATLRNPSEKSTETASVVDDELVPKAAHDARGNP